MPTRVEVLQQDLATAVSVGAATLLEVPDTTKVVEVIVAGPQGPRGTDGAGVSVLTYTQSSANTVWTFTHNLGRLPIVAVYIGGELIDANVVSTTTVTTVTLKTAQTGQIFVV